MASTRPLDAVEVRILGALMEKERTTPEQYPLTVASLLQACNQKTSRDPVTDYSETMVVEALDRHLLSRGGRPSVPVTRRALEEAGIIDARRLAG